MSFEQVLVALVGCLFGILILLLGWIGSRVHTRLDKLTEMLDVKLTVFGTTLATIEKDLRGGISELDRRISIAESAIHSRREGNGK